MFITRNYFISIMVQKKNYIYNNTVKILREKSFRVVPKYWLASNSRSHLSYETLETTRF